MFHKLIETNTRFGGRMQPGHKTMYWSELRTFQAFYSAYTDNFFELQVYPEAGRAMLTGYYNAKSKHFSHFDGQVDIDSQVVGANSWKKFIKKIDSKDSFTMENDGMARSGEDNKVIHVKESWRIFHGFEVILFRYGSYYGVTRAQADELVAKMPPRVKARIQGDDVDGIVIGTAMGLTW